MAGINKVILIGNLGADPEVRYSAEGTAVAKLSVATTEGWKNKQTGQWEDKTEWHRVTYFARQAEVCGEYLRKGSKVYVEGSLRTNKWQDQNGQDRYTTEVVGRTMQMLDAKGGKPAAMPEAPAAMQSAPAPQESTAEDAAFEDQIPF